MSLVLCFLVLCASSAWAIRSAPVYDLEDAEFHFENFIKTHGKQYKDENEKQARFEIFKVNLEKINQANKGQNTTTFGLTFFTDLTHEEFLRFTGYVRNPTDFGSSCSDVSDEELKLVDAPDAFDWREQNAVTPVKNQDQCGSCYAFSAIGNIESQYAIKNGQLLDLAEQQVVDCDTLTDGCKGGTMDRVFSYLIDAGGVESESDYPYSGSQTECQFDQNKAQVKLSGCQHYTPSSQERVKQLLYSNGPISIAIKADGLQYVIGGTIPDEQCDVGEVNHAVLLVGYGTDSNGTPIWIVKNSWGAVWGDQGYFTMERGEDKQSCGMMNELMSSAVL